MSESDHGSVSTYTNHKCRCDECRAAWRQAQLVSNANRAARLAVDPSVAPHGRVSTYGNWGCRCSECRAALARARRSRRKAGPVIDSDPRDSGADRTAIAGTSDRTWTTREGLRGALSGQQGASESRASGARR